MDTERIALNFTSAARMVALGHKTPTQVDSDLPVHLMPEVGDWDPKLLDELAEEERYGGVRNARFSLRSLFVAARAHMINRGTDTSSADAMLLLMFSHIINGLNLVYSKRLLAIERADNTETVRCGNFRIALLPPERAWGLNQELSYRGCQCGIFDSDTTLGIVRWPNHTSPDLRGLAPYLPGWFIHPKGFLAAWGTRKHPEHGPPPAETPRNAQELLSLVQHVFKEKP